MKKLTRIAVAGALAAAMIGGAVLTAAAAKESRPIGPIRPRPIVILPAKELPKQQIPLLKQMEEQLRERCTEYGVPFHVALGVIEAMSDFDNGYHGSQLGTERVGFMGVPIDTPSLFSDLKDCNVADAYGNFRAGCYLLGWLRGRHESWQEVLLCYDVGERNAQQLFLPWGETTSFARAAWEAALRWEKIVG